jgi:very-short-patch-repair endonuclease/transcriptional regulator with XRE-family HTH domain
MWPTKEQLIEYHYVLNMSQQEIAEKYGFKTRQVIGRLFKKYGIKSKSKSELAKDRINKTKKPPSKEELVQLYKDNSISQIAKKLNCSRKYISNLMSEYGIETTYFRNFINQDELIEDLSSLSFKEIEIKYNVPLEEIKRRILNKIEIPKILYSIERIKEILSMYDLNNQGFTKQIIYDDPNVHNSILEHTKDHKLQSKKITERVYRIIHDYSADYIPKCKETGDVLKFYTIEQGYGRSDLQLSKKGFSLAFDFSCHSNISQKLFWEIYNNLDETQREKVEFAKLNRERKVESNGVVNKYHFSLDFCLGNKNIEFDGEYWHSFENIQEKDKLRDKFLTESGYEILRINERDYCNDPQETLNMHIKFLT